MGMDRDWIIMGQLLDNNWIHNRLDMGFHPIKKIINEINGRHPPVVKREEIGNSETK
jgi:hypothetical protein